jgi:hypothetical protein
MGVAAVASPIGFPDIGNDRFGMLVLSLQGSDECVLSLDRKHLGAYLRLSPSVYSVAMIGSDCDDATATITVVRQSALVTTGG